MTARAKMPGVIILALSLLVGALAMLQSTAYGATSLAQKPQCKPHGQYAHPKKKCKPGGGVLGQNGQKSGGNNALGQAASQGNLPSTGADIVPYVVIALLAIGLGTWLVLRRRHVRTQE